tara:strand:- start:324 stop:560 length:237 start_codon:yes stop_codon:yes gene_type:complete
MEAVLVRVLFIFFVISFAILMFSIYKQRTAVVEVFKEWGLKIGIVLGLGVIIYLLFFTPVEKAPIGEEYEYCPKALVC